MLFITAVLTDFYLLAVFGTGFVFSNNRGIIIVLFKNIGKNYMFIVHNVIK